MIYNRIMRQSQLFTKTLKNISVEETSANAQLLTRGGFIYKNSAGVYTFLPLGWRVIGKLCAIIREEMNAIGGVEVFMPAMVEKKYLDATDRWKIPVGFEVRGKNEEAASFVLGWTHEEVITAIAKKHINSYKDLPVFVYQIQTKFRNEPRAKSGLLRGREFLMKDLYSFHAAEKDLFAYYEKVKEAYFKIFKRCGLKPYYTVAGGGDFTMSNTHEFQVLAEAGEDTIFYCEKCGYAENKEISRLREGDKCDRCSKGNRGGKGTIRMGNAIEIGNIFPLGTKYSKSFELAYVDVRGGKQPVWMGSYGIGVSRLMAAIVEASHDQKGIIWPYGVAPFAVHLVSLVNEKAGAAAAKVKKASEKIYRDLSAGGGSTPGGQKQGIEVLYDDREDKSYGEKFADADLIGIPHRLVVSERTVKSSSVEVRQRKSDKAQSVKIRGLLQFLKSK